MTKKLLTTTLIILRYIYIDYNAVCDWSIERGSIFRTPEGDTPLSLQPSGKRQLAGWITSAYYWFNKGGEKKLPWTELCCNFAKCRTKTEGGGCTSRATAQCWAQPSTTLLWDSSARAPTVVEMEEPWREAGTGSYSAVGQPIQRRGASSG